jgi:hypothetical protein
MRWLLFLSRLSFICGICFLLALSLLIKNWTNDEAITSTIIVIGYVIGLIVVPFTILCYIGVLIFGRKLKVPLWLVISNILFLFVLILYIIYINGNYDHPA